MRIRLRAAPETSSLAATAPNDGVDDASASAAPAEHNAYSPELQKFMDDARSNWLRDMIRDSFKLKP